MLRPVRVALFVPCYVDQLWPRAALATVRVLERHGVEVAFPEEQTCCGQPMSNAGLAAAAEPLARRFLEIFGGFEAVVCPSGSCTSMVRNHYDPFLAGAPGFARLKARTYELCEFLVDVLGVKGAEGRFAHRVALHQSCHGLRELGLGTPSERLLPRANKVEGLLRTIGGIKLVALARPDECCGFGGTFAVAEEAVTIRTIAEAIAMKLKLPLSSVAPEAAGDHFGWLGGFLSFDQPASSALTQQRMGWRPTHPGLIQDIEAGRYA